jgi:hypothetical protein
LSKGTDEIDELKIKYIMSEQKFIISNDKDGHWKGIVSELVFSNKGQVKYNTAC